MRNIDAKFEPYITNNDIRDDDYSRCILILTVYYTAVQFVRNALSTVTVGISPKIDINFRQDYPYMGKSRHTRQAAEGYRSIPGQMLSETGYASELSDAELGGTYGGGTYGRSGSSGKSGNSRSDSIDRRKKANETREKVKALEKLKHQANSIQEGNNSNRNNLFVKWFSFLIRAKLNIKEINYMKICDFLIRVALMVSLTGL